MSEWISVSCQHCGKPFKKKRAEIKRSPKHFCSRSCVGGYKIAENNKKVMTRFSSKDNGCMEWTGSRNRFGYGVTRYAGKVMLAHRAAYLYSVGIIPDGMCVCHKCDNPCCINPDHLFLGTHQDNMDDMAEKGRRYCKHG